jgi:perosamine synthetase
VVAAGIGPGDEVIMPAFTIISCAAAVVRAGARPLVVDADPRTFNIDVDQLAQLVRRKKARGGKHLKSIMAVHIYGLPSDMDAILALAQQYELTLIEDAAEMHGQTYKGRPCGSFGALSTFSFYPNKHVTTGEGGMLVTDDAALAERCRSLRNLYFDKERRYIHEDLGWNLRMSNIQAALGVAQLERLDDSIRRKREIGTRYTRLLADLPGLQLPLAHTDYADNIYWVYGLLLQDSVPFDASEAMKRLGERGIGTRHFFWPMHQQPVLIKRGLFTGRESFPVAQRLAQRGLYIPCGLAISDAQIDRAAAALREVLS